VWNALSAQDVVPIYAHMGDKTLRLVTLGAAHPSETIDSIVPAKIDRLSINGHEDLLADVKE
jgi:hypothetical protein